MTVIEYCRHETGVRELVIIRAGGYTCCAAVSFSPIVTLSESPEAIRVSDDHIKVLDHQGTYVSIPCTYLDIK